MVLISFLSWIASSLLILKHVDASCFSSMIKSESTASGRMRLYCEYSYTETKDGRRQEIGPIKIFPGSIMWTRNCFQCECSMSGLHCCGFGRKSGTFSVPEECEIIADGCQGLNVLKSNHSLTCDGKPLQFDKTKPHPDNLLSDHKLQPCSDTDDDSREKPENGSGYIYANRVLVLIVLVFRSVL